MVSNGKNDPWYAEVGGRIPGVKQIGIDKNGKSKMDGHHPSYAPADDFPEGKMNPKDRTIDSNIPDLPDTPKSNKKDETQKG